MDVVYTDNAFRKSVEEVVILVIMDVVYTARCGRKTKQYGCNPCYNGCGVHLFESLAFADNGCNPCYNGCGVHRLRSHFRAFLVVILVIMDVVYTIKYV